MVDIEPLTFLFEGKKDLVVAEIGIFKAGTTIWMLENFDIKHYYAIDPYVVYDEYNPSFIKNGFKGNPEPFYQDVKQKLEKYDNVELIREFSHDAVTHVEDEELDICYLDGNHAYEYVVHDINCWLPKVKKGGFLCGDDSFNPGVLKAIKEVFGGHVFDLFIGLRSWFIKKWDFKIYW